MISRISPTLELSVIVCTHNPRFNYFDRVLKSLQSQSLQLHSWELLIIDNASDASLQSKINIAWHPDSCCIREDNLGLTHARLKGIKEARSSLLVFIDDDNVLYTDYLEQALKIANDYPLLGAWGGQTIPEFEETPPEWTKSWWRMLAIHEFQGNKWSNLVNQYETTPCGAGICIRKFVAEEYAKLVENDPMRLGMDRKGSKLTSYGDSDMAFTSCDLGFGTGRFDCLKLIHIIPPERLQEKYLLRLLESSVYSGTIVESYRGKLPQSPKTVLSKIANWFRFLRMSPRDRRFYQARQRGLKLAQDELGHS